MANILHLTLHRKWFLLILQGLKKEEYREIKPYWTKRFLNKRYDVIAFRNGYAKDAPFMLVQCTGMRTAMFERKKCYALQLGMILETKNIEKIKKL